MRPLDRILRAGLGLAAAVCLLTGPVAVAQDVTTGRIVGQVLDSEGGPLPGVSVEAKSKGTGLVLTQVTDARGSYRIVNVPPGEYTAEAKLSGFQAQKKSLSIVVGSSVNADFKLALSTVAESVTVTAEAPVIETTQGTTQTTVDNTALQALPVNGRNFTDFVRLAPNAQRETQRGGISLSGQRGINTNVLVDGVDYTNAFFGGTAGSAEGRAPFSFSQEAIREFQVIQGGASAEYGRSSGGFVNVVTKSGTNDFHGSLFGYHRPSSLVSNFRNPEVLNSDGSVRTAADSIEPNEQKTWQYGLSIGGPILKDKLFFFGSFENQDQSQTVVLDPRIYGVDTASGSTIYAQLKTKYPRLFPDDTIYPSTQDGKVYFGRLDFQLTDQHRLSARANLTDYEGLNGTSTGTTRAVSNNGIETLDALSVVGSYSGTFGSIINDFNFQYGYDDIPRYDKGLGLPEIQIQNGPLLGETSFLPILATNDRITIANALTYLAGAHVAKAGVEYNDTSMDQIFKGNWRGVFVFNSSGSGATARSAEQNLLDGRWGQYREFIGLGCGNLSASACADKGGNFNQAQKELAFFIQDQWYATPNLTLTLGLRYEALDNPDAPILDLAKVLTPGAVNVQPDAQIPDDKKQFSPRLSVAYSPGSDGKTVVRMSLGRYFSRTPAILFSQLYTSNGIAGTQYVVNAGTSGPAAGIPAPGWGNNWNPYAIQQLGSLPPGTALPAPGVFAIDANFRNPYTDRITAGFEREVFGIALGLEGAYAKSKYLERSTDRNLLAAPAANCPALDPASGVACYGLSPTSTSQNRINTGYARVTTYASDARSRFWSATFNFRKNFANNLRFFGSVTRAEDKDTDSNERNFAGLFSEDLLNPEQNYGFSDRYFKWGPVTSASYEFAISDKFGLIAGAFYEYRTGRTYDTRIGQDVNKDGNNVDRPTVGGVHIERNANRQPDFSTLDLRLGVGFALGPGKMSIFAESFNTFNVANRSTSFTTYGTAQTPRTDFGQINLFSQSPRTIQLAARYDF